jgi:hypothetical protein
VFRVFLLFRRSRIFPFSGNGLLWQLGHIHFPFLKYRFFFVSGNIYGRGVSSRVLSGGSSQFEMSTALFQNLRISENENVRIVVSQVV